MIKNLVISLACAMPSMCLAQSDYQYRMEIGAGVGVVTYQGDLGGSLTKNMQPMASVVLRRVFNPYMALKFSAAYGKLKGSSADSNTCTSTLWYGISMPFSSNTCLVCSIMS